MALISPRLPVLGRIFFGLGMLGMGVMQLVRNDFVRLVPKLPASTPLPALWPRLIGAILVIAGVFIVGGKRVRLGAAAVATLLIVVLVLHAPGVASNPGAGFMWTVPSKALALFGGALFLAGLGLPDPARLWLCRIFLAQFLILAGIQHFVYAGFVNSLVPGWLPAKPFWTYFTAVALVAGGVGLSVPRKAVLAGALSGLMIFLWVLMLHVPRALAPKHDFGEIAGVCEAVALSGLALLATARTAVWSNSTVPK